MEEEDWWREFGHSVTLFVNGEGIRELGPQGGTANVVAHDNVHVKPL